MKRMTTVIVVLTLTLGLSACAGKHARPLSEAQRARLGEISVIVVDSRPKATVDGPTPLGGFGGGVAGATKGLAVGVVSGAGCLITVGYLVPACVSAVMTPYWVGRGTVEGALKALPEGQRRANQAVIAAAISDLDAQRIARTIEQRRGHAAPSAGGNLDSRAEITLVRIGLDNHESQASDSIWKLSVPDVDPTLDVVAELRLRLMRSADAAVIYKQTYVRHSARQARFAEWAREDAADFRSARDEVLDALARDVVVDLFGAERSVDTTASDEP